MAWLRRSVSEHGWLSSCRLKRPAWLWLIPGTSLLLTAVAWHTTRASTAARLDERFQFQTRVIEESIRRTVAHHENVLRGLVGLFDASGEVTRAEWKRYIEVVHPETSAAGLHAIGYAVRVPAAARESLERTVQNERIPFVIWPPVPRDDFHSVLYIYPFDPNNRRALGYDMRSDPVRHEAMARAADRAAAALSRQVRLVQDETRTTSPGFLLYLPVYTTGAPTRTIAERRAALRGFVYGAYRVDDLMASIFGRQQWDIDFEIYDGTRPTHDGRLYRSSPDARVIADASPEDTLTLSGAIGIAGHHWLLAARPSAEFLSFADRYQHWLIAGGGLALNALLWIGLMVSSSIRRRALAMAEGMAQAVRVSEAQTQLMVDSITDHAIFRFDANGKVVSWNAGAQRMLGYAESEALARPASQFWVGSDANPYADSIAIGDRRLREGWHMRKDGHRFWGAAAIAPLQNATGKASGSVVILRDDTSRRQTMEALAETSAALERRTIELGRFNRLASGRELRMIELKRMVNERSIRLGMQPPFDLSFAEDFRDVLKSRESSS